jgi:hypothetical protein
MGKKSYIFWDITPCSPLKVNRRFGETSRLHLQDRRISQATSVKAGGKQILHRLYIKLVTKCCGCPSAHWKTILARPASVARSTNYETKIYTSEFPEAGLSLLNKRFLSLPMSTGNNALSSWSGSVWPQGNDGHIQGHFVYKLMIL